jgi:putative membrane protein
LHCLVLFIGGHYTYARVPLFHEIADWLGTGRNSYDKIGHLFQGFTPVLVAREFLIKKKILGNGTWNSIATLSFAMAFSALYEIIEWLVAIATETGAEDFLGTQGYEWDTQADMFWALIGGLVMILLFTKIHNKAIKKMETKIKIIRP